MLTDTLIAVAGFTVLLAVLTAVETITPVERYSIRSRLPGVVYWALMLSVGPLCLAVFQRTWQLAGIKPLLTVDISVFGTTAAVIGSILFSDFLAYWNHRFQHRWLWAIHVLHHSQTELNAANGYAHFLERALRFLLFAVPLSLIHFRFPAIPFAVVLTLELLERYIHSPTTIHMGALRWVFVDNRYHRIHHSLEVRHFDKNFGILLSVWDRLFGTAYDPRPDEWPATGVAGQAPPRTIAEYALYPLFFLRQRASPAPQIGDCASR